MKVCPDCEDGKTECEGSCDCCGSFCENTVDCETCKGSGEIEDD